MNDIVRQHSMHSTGFWELLEELGPSHPDGEDIEWTASSETIARWLESRGFEASPLAVETALEDALKGSQVPPWDVTARSGTRFTFRQPSKP